MRIEREEVMAAGFCENMDAPLSPYTNCIVCEGSDIDVWVNFYRPFSQENPWRVECSYDVERETVCTY